MFRSRTVGNEVGDLEYKFGSRFLIEMIREIQPWADVLMG